MNDEEGRLDEVSLEDPVLATPTTPAEATHGSTELSEAAEPDPQRSCWDEPCCDRRSRCGRFVDMAQAICY